MLHIIRLLITLTAAAIRPASRRRARAHTPQLGWMSAEWIAEQRASHRS